MANEGCRNPKDSAPQGFFWGPEERISLTAAFQEQISCAKRGKPETSPESRGQGFPGQRESPHVGGGPTEPARAWPPLASPLSCGPCPGASQRTSMDRLVTVTCCLSLCNPRARGLREAGAPRDGCTPAPRFVIRGNRERGQLFPGRGFQSLAWNPARGASGCSSQAAHKCCA